MRNRIIGLIAIVMVVAACGSGTPDVSDGARKALAPHLQQIRGAAQNRNAALAATQLNDLRAKVAALEADGELSDRGAAQILAAADRVTAELALITTTTTTTAPPPVEDEKDENDEEGEGRKRKNGD